MITFPWRAFLVLWDGRLPRFGPTESAFALRQSRTAGFGKASGSNMDESLSSRVRLGAHGRVNGMVRDGRDGRERLDRRFSCRVVMGGLEGSVWLPKIQGSVVVLNLETS